MRSYSFYKIVFFTCFFYFPLNSQNNESFQKAENHFFPGLEYKYEKRWEGMFFFIQMADCQLGFMHENRSWDEENILLEKAVNHINRLHPKFVILCGDITHATPKEKMRDAQVRDFKKIVAKIDKDIPLICLCGNHDVGNIPDQSSINTYQKDFGSHYFSFWVGGVQGIVVNSSLIWDPSNAPHLYAEQLEWFKEQLQLNINNKPPIHRIVFAHHPWFLNKFDEEYELKEGRYDEAYFIIPKNRRLKFLHLMQKSNVSACFCGHYHRNSLAYYGKMPIITTSAIGKQLGDDTSGFRIVRVFNDRIEHEYFSFEN